jgi:hypothetical protein
MENHRIARVGLILLVLVASIGISASAILGLHQHTSSTRTCELCVVGHMPWSGPSAQVSATIPLLREWRQTAERPAPASEAELHATSSRAPPIL